MQSRNRNVLLGALASGGFALSLPAGRIAGGCMRDSCDLSLVGGQIPIAALSVGTALLVFHIGARIGRIRSGWLAALFLCSSFGWMIGLQGSLAPFLTTFGATLAAALVLQRSSGVDTTLPPRAIGLLWKGAALLALLGIAVKLFAAMTDDPSRGGENLAQGLFAIFPWLLILIAVASWKIGRGVSPPGWGFIASWALVVFWLSLIVTATLWSVELGNMILPILPPLALIAGLTLGPGPEGKLPRRMVRLNMEIVAAIGLIIAFLLLSAMVAPVETVLPEKLRNLWQEGFGGLRNHGILTMLLAFGMLGLSVATIQQARGAHWFRASLPLALLITLLHMFLA
ncbi:MAG: hypothetical protein P8K76_03670 [Candidatus Binatia bacterium]|nr:hypothetical protein [Candidatus Binatia bacterium]MDG1957564.1 hypothetical protein [Candidatus Binatia bacterium]MDG2008863.1 hypothetical protein [Candidatus Binatia bacterium]